MHLAFKNPVIAVIVGDSGHDRAVGGQGDGRHALGADGQRNVDLAKIFFARDIFFDNNHRWLNEMYDVLTENVYITLDMDVLDPSVMPSVSLPEPGGMEYFMLLRTLKEIFRRSNVIGLDVIGLYLLKK